MLPPRTPPLHCGPCPLRVRAQLGVIPQLARRGEGGEVRWRAMGGGDGEGGVLRARGTQPERRWRGQGA